MFILKSKPIDIPEDMKILADVASIDNTDIKFECKPMGKEWKSRIARWWYEGNIPAGCTMCSEEMRILRDRLLSIGGEAVCFAYLEPDIDNILEYGQLWGGENAMIKRGRVCGCHGNAANLWYYNMHTTRICTGYALSKDGMWRQHSWLVWIKKDGNTIIETTESRIAYYGFVMNTALCAAFTSTNM